ncbi:hypothetical protein [Lentibacter sp.]|uniref:hypothetical protein n=1 Tax=Lentibacter sp. TaxID=2024994 RepID=UPI003F69A91B
MSRKFIAAITLSALLAASFSAVPARADDRDTARALAGIVALALIGKALSDRKDDRHLHQTHRPEPRQPKGKAVHRSGQFEHQPLPPRVRKMTLPRRCLTVVQGRHKTFRYMGERCLQNNYQWSRSLPRACEIRVKGPRGVRTGYQAGCLKRNGYRLNG